VGMSCWRWEVCSVAVHDASGDRSRWGGALFLQMIAGLPTEQQVT